MKTLEVKTVDGDEVMDLVTLSPDGRIDYDTGRAQPMFETLIRGGMTPSEAFEMRTGWSNGYITSKLI